MPGTGLMQHTKKSARKPEYESLMEMSDRVISRNIIIKDTEEYLNKWRDIPPLELPHETSTYCFESALNSNITRIIYQMFREYENDSELNGNVLVFLATKVKIFMFMLCLR